MFTEPVLKVKAKVTINNITAVPTLTVCDRNVYDVDCDLFIDAKDIYKSNVEVPQIFLHKSNMELHKMMKYKIISIEKLDTETSRLYCSDRYYDHG